MNIKQQNKQRRHKCVRAKIVGTKERPRVSIFRSNKYIYVQLIDDGKGKTIISSNSSKTTSTKKDNVKILKTENVAELGKALAEKAKQAGVTEAVFDRGGYKYHGLVKAVAEGLRAGGLKI